MRHAEIGQLLPERCLPSVSHAQEETVQDQVVRCPFDGGQIESAGHFIATGNVPRAARPRRPSCGTDGRDGLVVLAGEIHDRQFDLVDLLLPDVEVAD